MTLLVLLMLCYLSKIWCSIENWQFFIQSMDVFKMIEFQYTQLISVKRCKIIKFTHPLFLKEIYWFSKLGDFRIKKLRIFLYHNLFKWTNTFKKIELCKIVNIVPSLDCFSLCFWPLQLFFFQIFHFESTHSYIVKWYYHHTNVSNLTFLLICIPLKADFVF